MSKVERNSLCPCGSGLKYKKCCLQKKGLAKHTINVMNSGAVSSLSSKFLGKKIISEKEDA
jgi:hypothetical protein